MLELYTYWSFTLNNPTESEMVLIRNPNQKYIREFVWTPEAGEKTETPHIQGWIRLQRNQAKPFMIKLYPRAKFIGIGKNDYNENTHQYAQKNDVTTRGLHTISLNDPIPNADTQLYRVLREAFDRIYPQLQETSMFPDKYTVHHGIRDLQFLQFLKLTEEIELQQVSQKANLEKIFVSPTYEKMKRKYWRQILSRIFTIEDATQTSGSFDRTDRIGETDSIEGENSSQEEIETCSYSSADTGDSESSQ